MVTPSPDHHRGFPPTEPSPRAKESHRNRIHRIFGVPHGAAQCQALRAGGAGSGTRILRNPHAPPRCRKLPDAATACQIVPHRDESSSNCTGPEPSRRSTPQPTASPPAPPLMVAPHAFRRVFAGMPVAFIQSFVTRLRRRYLISEIRCATSPRCFFKLSAAAPILPTPQVTVW
jgi:hypothetical protein